MNDTIFTTCSVSIFRTLVLISPSFILGAYGGCYRSGAKIKCTDSFKGEPLTLEIDVKSCKKPVKIDIKLDMLGVTHNKEFNGDQDIPLPEISFTGLAEMFLTVNPYPLGNGDLQLQVRLLK